MRRRPLLAVLVLALLLVPGCASSVDINTPSRTHPDQRYTLDAVRERAKRLRPGMSMMEVMILLGSPAQQTRSTWIYLPERTGLIIPADALQVSFERGVYVSHKFQPVVLGERLD